MAKDKKKEDLTPEERLQAALVPDWEQPYKVPENWCWTRLGASINLYNGDRGSNYPSKKDYQSRGIPFINAGAIVDGELNEAEFNYISEEKYNALRAGKIQQGDLLYCLRGSIGKTAIVHQEFKGAISSSLCILRTKESMLKEFLYYLLCSNVIWHQQALAENGSAQPNLSAASVMEYIIPLPPIPEQQRIVDRIESLFAKLDEAKQKAQDALDSFETRKAAILHKAFTGELTARWRKEHGVGMESWDSDLFKNIVTTVKDKFDPTTQTTSLRYIGLEHIQKNQGIIGFGTADDIKSLKTIFKTGDILYGKLRPYLNKHDIAQFDGICSTDILVYRTQFSQTAKYINYFMNTELFISTAVSNSKGINLPRVSEKEIGNIPINIPEISEQTEIVRILDDLLSKEQQAKEAAEAVLEQIELIKKSILARAFRGELGTNDPAEESAVELMKEII